MKILLLFPRLDVSFKEGHVPKERGLIPPIRTHWINFKAALADYCTIKGYQLYMVEKPLWQFKAEDYENTDYDIILIPHREKHEFNIKGKRCFYYMQTNFPQYFSIDEYGWGGNLSYLDNLHEIIVNFKVSHTQWAKLKHDIKNNVSKFEQPNKETKQTDYVLFLCQIPHDQTIKNHSKVSVLQALSETIIACKSVGKQLIVKGHPINPGSMTELKALTLREGATWVDDVSIHSLIQNSSHCVTVNSGSGLEVILHEKPIYTFGRSEYDSVAFKNSITEYVATDYEIDSIEYKNFIHRYLMELADSENPVSFQNPFSRIFPIF